MFGYGGGGDLKTQSCAYSWVRFGGGKRNYGYRGLPGPGRNKIPRNSKQKGGSIIRVTIRKLPGRSKATLLKAEGRQWRKKGGVAYGTCYVNPGAEGGKEENCRLIRGRGKRQISSGWDRAWFKDEPPAQQGKEREDPTFADQEKNKEKMSRGTAEWGSFLVVIRKRTGGRGGSADSHTLKGPNFIVWVKPEQRNKGGCGAL